MHHNAACGKSLWGNNAEQEVVEFEAGRWRTVMITGSMVVAVPRITAENRVSPTDDNHLTEFLLVATFP
jgi:hypothetical protein